MTVTHPLVRASQSLFRSLPRPVLFLLSTGLFVVLGADLLLPDALPLLDEAVLAFLLYQSSAALLGHRGALDGRPVTEDLAAGPLARELQSRCKELARRTAALRKEGHPLPGLDGVSGFPERAARLADKLKRADGFLSRRENDPWQVRREVGRLEAAVAEAEAGGEHGRQRALESALESARMHAREVRGRSAERDATAAEMKSLAVQVARTNEVLAALAEGESPRLPVGGEATGWDPALRSLLASLAELEEARAEVEEASARRVPEGP